MDAIDALGKRVTVGDVASKAGLQLSEAQKALQALAADTNGFLEVSDEGDVLYVFPKDYRSNLTAKSFRMKIEPLLEKAKLAGEYLVRVSFGTTLIASIVIVYTTIIAILSSRSEEDNRGRRGRSYDSGFSFYFSPTDLFWYWDPYYYRRRRVRKESGGMNFIESVFSFVFGDGDPNPFRDIGKYSAADYAKITSENMSKMIGGGEQRLWNPFELDLTIKRRRYFVVRLLHGTMRGLSYMHDNDRLHQSLGPASVVLNTVVEKDAAYLIPRLRDLAFSVDLRYSQLEDRPNILSEGLWRRASVAGASSPLERRAFGIADDIYEAGLLFAYLAFVPFCEAGVMDSISLRRLLENTFQLDLQAARE